MWVGLFLPVVSLENVGNVKMTKQTNFPVVATTDENSTDRWETIHWKMEQTMKIEYVFVFTFCELIIYLEMFQRDQSSAIYSSECEKKNRKCFSLQVSITQRCISVSFSSHLSLALELALSFPNICSQIFYFFYLSWWNLSYKIECNEIINGNFSLGHVLYIQCSLQNVCVLFQCNACLHSSFFSTKSY